MSLAALGAYEQLAEVLRSTLSASDDVLGLAAAYRTLYLIDSHLAVFDEGAGDEAAAALDEAEVLARSLVDLGKRVGAASEQGRGGRALAEVLKRRGRLEDAEREARAAVTLLAPLGMERIAAEAVLAGILLAAGRPADAIDFAERSVRGAEELGIFGFRNVYARVVLAEALAATGDRERAAHVAAAARDRVLTIASRIDDEGLAESFLQRVPENVRALSLAKSLAP
jgi:tetratricopeptide (TPR) repeat protein